MATVMLVLVAVLAVALAAVVIGFILYTKDLRSQNRALMGELKEASAQLERRTKKAVGSARTSHVGLITEQLAPLLPRFPDCNLKDVQWIGGTIDMIIWNGLEVAHATHYPVTQKWKLSSSISRPAAHRLAHVNASYVTRSRADACALKCSDSALRRLPLSSPQWMRRLPSLRRY
jgi:predicted Holliday junction resolvase-like endonuclease